MSEEPKKKKRRKPKQTWDAIYRAWLGYRSGASKEFLGLSDISKRYGVSVKCITNRINREKWVEQANLVLKTANASLDTREDFNKKFAEFLREQEDSTRKDLAEAGAKAARLANRKGGGYVLRNASAIKNVAEFSEKATAKWGGPTPEEQAATGSRLNISFLLGNIRPIETPIEGRVIET